MTALSEPCAVPVDAVVLEDVTVSYGRTLALESVSLRVPRGMVLGIVGPNGSGKSTLLNAIAGIVSVVHGSVHVFGRRPSHLPAGSIGYVPQIDAIDSVFPVTVLDVVTMGRYPYLRPLQRLGRRDRELIARAMHDLDIEPLAGRRISDLSGGQRQRAFLARALAQEPRLLLLDEPTTGVDAATEDALRSAVRAVGARGITVMMTTHDLDELGRWFDSVLVVDRRIVAHGSPAEIDEIAAMTLPRRGRLLQH